MEHDVVLFLNGILKNLGVYKKEIYWGIGAVGALLMFFKHYKLYVDNNASMLFTRKLLGAVEGGLNQAVENRISPLKTVGMMGTLPVALALDIVLLALPGVTIKVQKKVKCVACKNAISPKPKDSLLPVFCNACVFSLDIKLRDTTLGTKVSKLTREVRDSSYKATDLMDLVPIKCRSCKKSNIGDDSKIYLKDGFLQGVCKGCWETKYFKKSKK